MSIDFFKRYLDFLKESLPIDEGINDPHIFKAVFLLGPMGAGKTTIARQLLAHTGLKSVNLDNFNELWIKHGKIEQGELSPQHLERSYELTQKQKSNFIDQRLGMMIDGSGRNLEGVTKAIDELENIGYDVLIILVNVSFMTSLLRQKDRYQKQVEKYGKGRKVPYIVAKTSYNQVQNNVPKLKELYGDKLLMINNDSPQELSREEKIVNRFLSTQPSKSSAIDWIEQQKAKRVA